MSLWDSAKKQFIDVIDWTEPEEGILAWRFPVADNEIKDGAQLTVRDSQVALFVEQGKPADVFAPGLYTLTTENLPVLTKLKSWPYGFKSPFKAEVYFYSLRQQLGQRWGTPAPITIRDKEFGAVQIRMFGIFSYHVSDVPVFYREISGTREKYTRDELNQQLVGQIAGNVASAFAQSGVPFLDMAANQAELSAKIRAGLAESAAKLGVALDSFVIESISLPEALQQALNDKMSMGIIGNEMGKFGEYQAARAMTEAAKNPGGMAGIGAGLAVGASVGQAMTAGPACGKCGTKSQAGAQFCSKCGNKL
ncbi:MAG: SPFH domain-containing protein [Myxococcales bacterium]